MNRTLKLIEFPWEFGSCSDACFTCDDSDGLDVWFRVYLGEDVWKKTIDDYLIALNLNDEMDIPDEIHNNAGYTIAHFKFAAIGMLLRTIREDIPNDGDYVNGVYEEFSEDNKRVRHVFLGHDWALSVYADKYTLSFEDMPSNPK